MAGAGAGEEVTVNAPTDKSHAIDVKCSYDAIFALVNSELMDDYTKAEEKMERYG